MVDPHRQQDFNRLLLAAAVGLALFLVAGLLWGQPLDPRRALEISQAAQGRLVGDYTLRDTQGAPLRLANYRGKPLVVSFVYTGCAQVCPTATRSLANAVGQAQDMLGRDAFRVVTVGFNLPFDTPSAMADFQRRHGIALANWSFLAADEATLAALAQDVGFVWAPTAGGFDHLTQATIVDARGRVYRQVYGESIDAPMLAVPLRELVTGAPAPAPGVAGYLDKLRILCTVYDPRSGRYRLDYALFIEIAAGLSILGGTAWYLVSEWRRQRPA
jgi:protein SCO1/2